MRELEGYVDENNLLVVSFTNKEDAQAFAEEKLKPFEASKCECCEDWVAVAEFDTAVDAEVYAALNNINTDIKQ